MGEGEECELGAAAGEADRAAATTYCYGECNVLDFWEFFGFEM